MENMVNIQISNFWKNRKVLITGHTGFKGSWLTLWLLLKGARVWGFSLDDLSHKNLFSQIDLLNISQNVECSGILINTYGDITKGKTINELVQEVEPEVVIHLAAQPLVRQSYIDPVETWNTNVIGSIKLLEALKKLSTPCAVVMVTTDKVYENKEWIFGYREDDQLGGRDPYSASKAAMEIAVSSWRSSFCGRRRNQNPYLAIATARAGNVIGGGDWSNDRVIPDAIDALINQQIISLRNPQSSRPWQHVLDPINGYMCLGEMLYNEQLLQKTAENKFAQAFNFGPSSASNRTVKELIEKLLIDWPGEWEKASTYDQPHEAGMLKLTCEKAKFILNWEPKWDFDTSVSNTANWYKKFHKGHTALRCCMNDLRQYEEKIGER